MLLAQFGAGGNTVVRLAFFGRAGSLGQCRRRPTRQGEYRRSQIQLGNDSGVQLGNMGEEGRYAGPPLCVRMGRRVLGNDCPN